MLVPSWDQLLFLSCQFSFFGSFGISSWKSYLLFQAGVAGIMIPCSLFLKPLNARMKGPANQNLISYMMGMDELKVFRSLLLYVFAAVCCCWGGGISVIEAKLPSFKGLLVFLPAGQLLVYVILLTSLVGTCFSCCISSNIRLRSVVIAMAVFSGILFLLNMMANMLYDFIYAIVYSILVGVLKGIGEPLLEYFIPLLLGDDNAAIGAGILTFGQGLGSLSMPSIANEIEKSTQKVDGCFYLAGAIFFLSAACIIFAYRLHLRETKRVVVPDDPDEKPSQDTEVTGMDMERF
ncbi:uncharacterized protein LOC124289143 [Haliotis rubra]|uniref:uncharacterized protein LOC124289143 n=1 Tax=Haliotis rubra TaxID=36100 RepID=UPI001EE5FB18|nr:uncharacterized protein LOC124289143 [Haliotis rubra]